VDRTYGAGAFVWGFWQGIEFTVTATGP